MIHNLQSSLKACLSVLILGVRSWSENGLLADEIRKTKHSYKNKTIARKIMPHGPQVTARQGFLDNLMQ